jgi:integrase/recombinase XerC
MLCFVYKHKGSRVYRARYRLSDGPKIYDVPLGTHIKEVAEVKARQLLEEGEKELVGLLEPKTLRVAAQRPLSEHSAEYLADLAVRNRGRGHLVHAKCRLQRLQKDCRWQTLRDVTAESFTNWRSRHAELSAKTLNEYLAHAAALLNWMERQGRTTHNPLKAVHKLERKETFRRRALSSDDFIRLVQKSGKRGFPYLVAGLTGLRRGEMKQLLWSDIHLDAPQPFIDVRAETTKSKKGAVLPIVPVLVEAFQKAKAKKVQFSDRVFLRGLPSVKSLSKDLTACGLPVEDKRGYRVDFHALRHTFASMLANVGVSELARVKLARHSEWRQTDRYTDPQSIPLFGEMEKLATILPPLGAPLKSGKIGQNGANLVHADFSPANKKIPFFRGERPVLAKAVPSWDSPDLVPEGGLEPPCG